MANKDVAKLIAAVQKAQGPGSIMTAAEVPKRPRVSSGSLALDLAIGGGGLPADRVVELFGSESAGKTTLALTAMRNFLDAYPDRYGLYIDTEGKTPMDRVEQLLGPERMERFIPHYPADIEKATDTYREFVSSGHVCFVLYDSIAGGIPKRVTERSAEVSGGGRDAARLISEFARVAGNHSNRYECCTMGINQLRVDQDGYHRYVTVGGNAWRHHCSLRILIRERPAKFQAKVDGETVEVGTEVVGRVVKNQVGGIEGREAFWRMYTVATEQYGFGIDQLEEIVRLGIIVEVIKFSGGWYHHRALPGPDKKGEHKVQGKDRLVEVVRSDPVVYRALFEEISAVLRTERAMSVIAPVTDDAVTDLDGSPFGPNVLQRAMEELSLP